MSRRPSSRGPDPDPRAAAPKHSGPSRRMARGLRALQTMASRRGQALGPPPGPPSRPGPAAGQRSQTTSEAALDAESPEEPDSGPADGSLRAKLERLRRLFLTRPGCPQLITRATSMSHQGLASGAPVPEQPGRDAPAWKTTEDWPPGGPLDGRPPLASRSACELRGQRGSAEALPWSPAASSLALAERPLRRRVPWYIAVIHEEERCRVRLEAEVRRLKGLEAQAQGRARQVLELQRERETLRAQLRRLLGAQGQDALLAGSPPRPSARDEELWRPQQQVPEERGLGKDLEEGACEEEQEGRPERAPEEAAGAGAAEAKEAGAAELEEAESEALVSEEPDSGSSGAADSLDEAFERELMEQLQEYERAFQDLQLELDVTKTRYSLALGTIASLQRQVDLQGSQLQKTSLANEMLEKELRERKLQLQAMSYKFSSLRDDRKHPELLGLVEKENLRLRQQVADLERALQGREDAVRELEAGLGRLREQVGLQQSRLQRGERLQQELQGRQELAQQAEQQASVALESCQSRLERLRSKIIQAAFSVTGVKSVSSEISDSDILEALQTIISERTEYYNQLRQKGVRVPLVHQMDVTASPSKSKKPFTK